jgi:hypothetical protein
MNHAHSIKTFIRHLGVLAGIAAAVATSPAQTLSESGRHASAPGDVASMPVMSIDDLPDPKPRDVAAMLSLLGNFSLQTIAVPDAEVPFAFEAHLTLDGQPITLQLAQHSVRGAGFNVFLEMGPGETVVLDPGPVRTYRGDVAEMPGSIVSATLFRGGNLTARIATPDGNVWWVEQLNELGVGMHVVYKGTDLIPQQHSRCGVDDHDTSPAHQEIPGGYSPRTSVVQAVLGFEGDYEYVNSWGNGSVAEIEGIVNDDNVIYEAETSICHRIRAIGLWGSDIDPYYNDDASTILNAFKDSWNNQAPMSTDFRHAAQLISGKDFNGNTVGLAKVSGIAGCQINDTADHSNGYSIIESLLMRSRRVANSCHELGHNWGASHCDGDSTCGIMNSSMDPWPIPGRTSFGSTSANVIITTRQSLEACTRDCDFTPNDAVCTSYCFFPTASAAHASAALGATIRFYPRGLRDNAVGTYNEQFRWTRPMTLTAPQGVVVIGR